MAVDETEKYEGYEALCPWHHRQPFDGIDQYARVITAGEASYLSSVPFRSEPVWMYVSTMRLNTGTLYVEPGEWFDPGDHPGPEPYFCVRGCLHLGNPDTADVIEISAGDAANIPALAQHYAWNFGDEVAEIVWWVPGEMHTEEWKRKIHEGVGKWYEREPVTLNGTHDRNEGFPSHLDDLSQWPPESSTKGPLDMQHLPRSTWLNMFQGTDRRRIALVSFFYCDERLRLAHVSLPKSRETEPESGDYERVLYVLSGTLSVAITGTGKGLIARPGEMIFVPPYTEHSLQAINGEKATLLSAWAYA